MHEVRKKHAGCGVFGLRFFFFFFPFFFPPRAREALGSKIAKRLLSVTSATITTRVHYFCMFFIFDSSPFILPFLSHSKGASALNQAAPSNAFELANHYYDAMDPALSLPDHNGGKAACTGGPSCASLCAGTSFYQTMKATMLSFWRTTKLSAVDQDGSRYDESYGPIRPN